MDLASQKRLLQAIVVILCLVPLSASLAGILLGPRAFFVGFGGDADLDSHFRYLSGIFLGVAIGFLSCVPGIERKGERFLALTGLVMLGGAARAYALAVAGAPSWPHLAGLGLELGVVPLLAYFQARLAGAYGRARI